MAEVFEIKAAAKHLPVSPQKARRVIDEVRGMGADQAMNALRFMPQKSAEFAFKLIQSAVANAENLYGLEPEELVITKIYADDGPRRRLAPYGGRFGGRGRFKPIIKRTSHMTVVLAEREATEF